MAESAEGAPCWAVAQLPDLAAGKRFYGELLGWSFGRPDGGRELFTTATLDGRAVAGLMAKPDGRMPTDWLLHLYTSDAAATLERIRAAGGRAITEPFPLGDAGTTAVAADPSGAVFQLWQPGTHRGFQVSGRPGAYVWAEVHTRDKAAVDPFYSAVFGFETLELTEVLGEDFLLWAPHGQPADAAHAVGGRALIAPEAPRELPAHFLTYFAVGDCEDAVRRAERLGGRVVRGPLESPYGTFAVLADNQGAYLAVLAVDEQVSDGAAPGDGTDARGTADAASAPDPPDAPE